MYTVARSALVMHSAGDMFALVNDVDAYEEFLPWCGGSEVLERNDDEVIARVDIAFRGIHKSFVTRNRLQPVTRTAMSLVEGPFSELTGTWDFTPIDEKACRISLDLRFGFSNRLVEKLVGPVFRAIADSMVESFVKRADDLYGTP